LPDNSRNAVYRAQPVVRAAVLRSVRQMIDVGE
jgi:hypothetical protein